MRFSREALITALLVVAALVVGTVITGWLPSAEEITSRPFVHTGTLGQAVQQRTGSFTVTKIEATRTIDFVVGATTLGSMTTNGIFVVLHIEVRASGEAQYLAGDDLRILSTDGRKFGGKAGTLPCGPAQPGLPITCLIAVETVPEALVGAHLRLPAADRDVVGPAEYELADIDLGITDTDAGRLAASTARIQLGEPTPKGA